MGRYIQRVENTARLVLVTENFSEDDESSEAWRSILRVFDEEGNFADQGMPLTAENVAKYFLTNKNSMSSVITTLSMVKENARSLRHLISTETWVQISRFYNDVEDMARKKILLSNLTEICNAIRSGCYEHYGVIEATCYRDEAWLFNRIGGVIERADQMTRLIDMKYFQFDEPKSSVELTAPDVVWWNTMLRSASAYHAFRRRHSFNPAAEEAAAFFLFDEDFARSVAASVNEVFECLEELEEDYEALPDSNVREARDGLQRTLAERPSHLAGGDLHGYIDKVQSDIITLSNALSSRYFSTG